MNDPVDDGYVECTGCGHPIEKHDTTGCHQVDGCGCPTRWTQRQIGDVRRDNGLPRRYDPYYGRRT